MMNETHQELLEMASGILSVQEYLDPRTFASNGKMHKLLRQQLLYRANYMARETVNQISGLNIDDIVLIGSSASYFYRKESDLDVCIIVSNKSCPYITTSLDNFAKYLSASNASFFRDHKNFFVGKRYIDMKLAPKIWDNAWTGAYSLTKNKWLIKPSKDIAKNLTPKALVEHYYARCQEIDEFMNQLPENGEKYSQEQCDKMFRFYAEEVIEKNPKPEDHLTFKMIKTTGKLKELGSWVFNNQLEILKF